VIRVTGTPTAADARIRVTAVRHWHGGFSGAPPPVGQLGILRLRHGVVTDPLTRATYCAPNVDRCGL
jgi:hypothetical protein